MIKTGFITAYGINYAGTLPKIKKSENKLQPLFEALTNSLESLELANKTKYQKKITIKKITTKNLFSAEKEKFVFKEFIIEDNGIGFTDLEFERIISLNDNRKGFLNKGTGRVQFIHFFDKTDISSIYLANDGSKKTFKERKLELSKKKPFLDKNAIIKYISNNNINAKESSTKVHLKDAILEKDQYYYNDLNITEIKEEIINHFLAYFCENRPNLPEICIQSFVDNELSNETCITADDIPKIDYETNFNVNFSEKSDSNSVVKTGETASFNIKSFVIEKDKLHRNGLKLISKGQVAKNLKIRNLSPNDHISKNRYLFLLSGDYIDQRDSDNRGDLKIPTLDEFKDKSKSIFHEKEVILEDIESDANEVIEGYYSEIKKKTEDKLQNIEKLKKMFLLNSETIASLNIGINDSDTEILKKVYQSDAKIIAKRDAEIKQQLESLENLKPESTGYANDLEDKINELVKTIPLQNRTALTHYVARRKLVLELFEKIITKQKQNLANKGRIDEDIMHNLLFQQSSEDPGTSDLWIFNEEFIYFKGVSEKRLSLTKLDGKLIFKQKFAEEEERYLNSLGERRTDKRPDILLFPAEGKCIIIEFKSPDVNASEHLTQIDFYANLIRNYTIDELQITSFYGYLIGENIEPRDVLGRVSRYEESYHFDYLFRPSENVNGFDGRKNGSIYSEVIKYSTLLERAKLRNKVFIDKLTENLEKKISLHNIHT
tara:strand:- start:86 stop:2242 length:2157 start_codon:yes stop_codon:yes gene_type:complete